MDARIYRFVEYIVYQLWSFYFLGFKHRIENFQRLGAGGWVLFGDLNFLNTH